MKAIRSLFKRSAKPDYMQILAKTCKEMPIVIRRMIKHEDMKLSEVYHLESKRHYDVVLISESPQDRVFIIRHPFGTTKAFYQDFDPTLWRENINPVNPNLDRFLDLYGQTKELDRTIWN